MPLRLLASAVLLSLLESAPAIAACTSYDDPTLVSKSSFVETDFGTIGLIGKPQPNRALIFDKSSCYDIAYLKLNSLKLYLNTADTSEKPSFLAANAIRTYDYDMGGEPKFQIKFRRNGNADETTAKWVRVDKQDKIQEGGSFNGAFGIVLGGAYDPPEKLEFSELSQFLGTTKLGSNAGLLDKWHALIVPVEDSATQLLLPDTSYKVEENTYLGIDPVGMEGIDLTSAPQETVISQVQLIKFARSPKPNLASPLLDISVSRASCLYLRYRIDGQPDVYFKPGNIPGDYLVLRLKAGATC